MDVPLNKLDLITHALVSCDLTPKSPEFRDVCKKWLVEHFPNKCEKGIGTFVQSFWSNVKNKYEKNGRNRKTLLTEKRFAEYFSEEIILPDEEMEEPSPPKTNGNNDTSGLSLYFHNELWRRLIRSKTCPDQMEEFQDVCLDWLIDRFPGSTREDVRRFVKSFHQQSWVVYNMSGCDMKAAMLDKNHRDFFAQQIKIRQYDELGKAKPDLVDSVLQMNNSGCQPGMIRLGNRDTKPPLLAGGPVLTMYADTAIVAADGFTINLNRALLASVSPMLREAMAGLDPTVQVEIRTEATGTELKQFHHFVTRGVVVIEPGENFDLATMKNLSMFGVLFNIDTLAKVTIPCLRKELESVRAHSSCFEMDDHIIEGQIIDKYLGQHGDTDATNKISATKVVKSETIEICDAISEFNDEISGDPLAVKKKRKRSIVVKEDGMADMKSKISDEVMITEKQKEAPKKRKYIKKSKEKTTDETAWQGSWQRSKAYQLAQDMMIDVEVKTFDEIDVNSEMYKRVAKTFTDMVECLNYSISDLPRQLKEVYFPKGKGGFMWLYLKRVEQEMGLHTKKHQCLCCGRQYDCTLDYLIHLSSSGEFHNNKCPECIPEVWFTSWVEHQSHLTNTHRIKNFERCSLCPSAFTTKDGLDAHVKDAHHEVAERMGTAICPECGVTLKSNRESGTGDYNADRLLRKHMNKHHGVQGQYNCNKCGQLFKIQYTYERHLKAGDCVTCCEYCGKNIKKLNYEYHLNMHRNLKPYKCSVCPNQIGFADKRNLDAHIRSVHRGIKRKPKTKSK